MNLIFLKILVPLLLSFLWNQNFHYNLDDWEIYRAPGSINTITEDYYNVYFGTDEGIYTWSKSDQMLYYDYGLSRDLEGYKIRHLYFDHNSSFFWASHEGGLSFKSEMATHWRYASYDPAYWDVDDIGSTSDFICIRNGGQLNIVNSFSGYLMEWDEYVDEEDVDWGTSRYGRAGVDVDMFGYQLDPIYQSVKRVNDEYFYASPTVAFEDDDENYFIGTVSGGIYLSQFRSRFLEPLSRGLGITEVTEIYRDEFDNWWFADSEYKRKGISQYTKDLFISRWIPEDDRWINYYSDDYRDIENTNINCIIRDGYFLFCGTMEGILVLNTAEDDWSRISKGLKDEAIWDLEIVDDVLIAATARGISEIALESRLPIEHSKSGFARFDRYEVYDFEKDNEFLYVASENGLHRMELDSEIWEILDEQFFREVHVENGEIIASDGNLWKIDPDGESEIFYTGSVFNFNHFGSFIWVNERSSAVLLQKDTAAQWTFDHEDGIPGSFIYEIDADQDYTWFATNKGIAFFNWSNYYNIKE